MLKPTPDYICLLARAVVKLLHDHGYAVPSDYVEHRSPAEWTEFIQDKLPVFSEFASYQSGDEKSPWAQLCSPTPELHKDFRNLLLLQVFSTERTLEKIAGMTILGSQTLFRRDLTPPPSAVTRIWDDTCKALRAYRNLILQAFRSRRNPAEIPLPEVFFSVPLITTARPSLLDPVSYEKIEFYVKATKHHVRRYLSQCDSPNHKFEFEWFMERLDRLWKMCTFQRNDQGLTDFRYLRHDIATLSFQTEFRLLELSLAGVSSQTSFYFSDDGFARNNGQIPVWHDERPRRNIVEHLGYCRSQNPHLHFCRILLLDSLDLSAYSPHQLQNLSIDFEFLLRNGIDVAVSTKRLAKEVGRNLYNYAIGSDGTIMQADEDHAEWSLAKVRTDSATFKKLFENFSVIYHQAENLGLVFRADYYRIRTDWLRKTLEERRMDPVLRDLQDKLANLPKKDLT